MQNQQTTAVIALIGVNENTVNLLRNFLGYKYLFITIKSKDVIHKLDLCKNINLLIINTDWHSNSLSDILIKIKNDIRYYNIPIIGLVLKRYILKMEHINRNYFDDILPIPTRNEDIINRIEVWIKTYKFLVKKKLKGRMIYTEFDSNLTV
ncbi:MAG: hypothetical protein ACTSWY_01000 [Promethearchaeota archaeon]